MKIISAVFKSNTSEFIHHPGFKKSFKGTLTPAGYPGIDMSLTGQGVKIKYNGVIVIVPLTKFDYVEVEDTDVPKSKK